MLYAAKPSMIKNGLHFSISKSYLHDMSAAGSICRLITVVILSVARGGPEAKSRVRELRPSLRLKIKGHYLVASHLKCKESVGFRPKGLAQAYGIGNR